MADFKCEDRARGVRGLGDKNVVVALCDKKFWWRWSAGNLDRHLARWVKLAA